jgi:DNA polymerase-1
MFGTALLDRISPVTGRLHGNYVLPTKTGRLSCRDPNPQQFPPDVRAAIRPEAGKLLLDGEYGQIELRILAERAGENVIRAAFAAGQDIHMLTATRFAPNIEQLPETEQKLLRNKAKAVNYGLPYGMGAKTLRRKA